MFTEGNMLETAKVLLEIAALVFLPIVAWLLRTVVNHSKQLTILEGRINSEINRRLDVMERKIDTFDNKRYSFREIVMKIWNINPLARVSNL